MIRAYLEDGKEYFIVGDSKNEKFSIFCAASESYKMISKEELYDFLDYIWKESKSDESKANNQ